MTRSDVEAHRERPRRYYTYVYERATKRNGATRKRAQVYYAVPKSDGGTKDEKSKCGFGFCAFESMIAWSGVVELVGVGASGEIEVPGVEI